MSALIAMIGCKHGRWTVVARAPNRGKEATYLCRCDCGTGKAVIGSTLRSGASRSCGCFARQIAVATNTRHGGAGTRLHEIWQGIRRRCFDRKHGRFPFYGGRGISMCAEWQHDFAIFREWALANGYADHLTIDRIDNDGKYEPDNCRWATKKDQARNKRSSRSVTRSDGIMFMTMAEAAERTGCSPQAICHARSGRTKSAGGYRWS